MIKKISTIILSILILASGFILFTDAIKADDLPDSVSIQMPSPTYPGGPAYFPDVIITNGANLDGTYIGWCIDTDSMISRGPIYNNVIVYSSYEYLPEGIVEFPENLDLVNWVINQDIIGQPSTCGENYTYSDVQKAIWELIEDYPMGSGLGEWSQCRVNEIVAAAYENGEGFIAKCGDKLVIILDPGDLQTIIIEFEKPCEDLEGLSPGFWKRKGRRVGWPSPYTTDMTFEEAGFIIPDWLHGCNKKRHLDSHDTLLEALKYRGGRGTSGMARILLRAATAALLNAAHTEVNYPLSVDEIINLVNDALIQNRATMRHLKNELDTYNNLKADEWW